METNSLDFLKALMATHVPSGHETAGQRLFRDRTKAYCDRVTVDVHGNVTAVLNEGAPCRIMLAGHGDEIGIMVTDIGKDGMLSFAAIGGIDPPVLVGSRVTLLIENGEIVSGVIGRKPIHLIEESERKKTIDIRDLWIDIGAISRVEALALVPVGTPGCVVGEWYPLLNSCIAAKGFDDKVGVFIVAEVMRILSTRRDELRVAVFGVSTVSEEIGSRGAATASYTIGAHAGIAVDVGFASDTPGGERRTVGDIRLGKGPILHRGANFNAPLVRMLSKAALDTETAIQWSAEPSVSPTDADVMQINRAGMATALVSIPLRYMHTPVEVVSLVDVEAAVTLIVATILQMGESPDFIPF